MKAADKTKILERVIVSNQTDTPNLTLIKGTALKSSLSLPIQEYTINVHNIDAPWNYL